MDILATALATQMAPSDFHGISSIADGINHTVPTHKELQTSVSWLIQKDMVEQKGKKYLLTEKGRNVYEETSRSSTKLLQIWKLLEQRIVDYE